SPDGSPRGARGAGPAVPRSPRAVRKSEHCSDIRARRGKRQGIYGPSVEADGFPKGGTMSRQDVEAGEKKWLEAFNGGDASGVAQRYAEDGRLMPPNSDTLQGRSAIEPFIKEFLQMKAKLSFKLVDLHDAGDTCVAIGQYEMEFEPPD